MLLFFFFGLHFCETKPVVAKFYNMGVQRLHVNKYEPFYGFFFLMQDPVTLIQGPLTLSYLKQQFEKNTSKIKQQTQHPRERQMLLVVSL